MLFVPERVVVRLLLMMLVAGLVLILHLIFIFALHVILVVIVSHVAIITLHASLMVHLFLLGELSGQRIIFGSLLALVVFACLSFHNLLQVHPFLVTACLALLSHLLLNLFTAVQLAKVGDFLCLVNLSLHEPVVHSFASSLILLPLVFSYIKQLFLDFILCLANELALQTLLRILCLKPVRV